MAEDAGEGCWVEAVDPWYTPWWCSECGQRNDDEGPNCFMCNTMRHEADE